MAAAKHSLTADRGATFKLAAQYSQPDGSPVDLTGYQASLVLLQRSETAVPIATYAGTTDADGLAVVKVADEVTAAWPVGRIAYRLQVESPSGEKDFLLVGPLTVRSPADV